MIEAIVFDMGGVFFKKSVPLRARVFERYHVSEEWLEEVQQMPSYTVYKDGQMSQQDFISQVDALLAPKVGSAHDVFRDLSFAHELNEGLVGIVHRLRSRYRIAVLSNSDSFLEKRLIYFGVWDLFEFVINSYRIRLRKPDPRIFQHLLLRIGLAPDKILFIDDKVVNVNAARALNIRGHVFSDNVELIRYLAQAGISL